MENPSFGCSGEAGITPYSTRVMAEDTALGMCEKDRIPRPVKMSMLVLEWKLETTF
jgi:hypothetical protein